MQIGDKPYTRGGRRVRVRRRKGYGDSLRPSTKPRRRLILQGALANRAGRRMRTVGAGDGNRTRTASLEGWSSAVELHPHGHPQAGDRLCKNGVAIKSASLCSLPPEYLASFRVPLR